MTVQEPIGSSGEYGDNVIAKWFRETPVTMWIVAFNVVTWIAAFFGHDWPLGFLVGKVSVGTAWKVLTYPLGGIGEFGSFAIMVFVFGMFARSLERGWGSIKFARVCVVATLASAFFNWVGFKIWAKTAVASAGTVVVAATGAGLTTELPYVVGGLVWLDLVVIVIWCALYRNSSILFLFVIPMQAWVMAIIAIVGAFFSAAHPTLGAFLILTPGLGWFWATRYESAAAAGPQPSESAGSGPRQWLADRKRAKQKERFKVLEGGVEETAPRPIVRSRPRASFRPEPVKDDSELDRILDKIRFEGMEALTEDERATLDKKSQTLRESD